MTCAASLAGAITIGAMVLVAVLAFVLVAVFVASLNWNDRTETPPEPKGLDLDLMTPAERARFLGGEH
jgi:hypothetical protein